MVMQAMVVNPYASSICKSSLLPKDLGDKRVQHLHFHITFDGGSRGNPGVAGCGAVVSCQQSATRLSFNGNLPGPLRWMPSHDSKESVLLQPPPKKVTRIREYVGDFETNNMAEWKGVCSGLLEAKIYVEQTIQQNPDFYYHVHLLLQGDSKLVIDQLHGTIKCHKPYLREQLTRAECYMDSIESMKEVVGLHRYFQHIPRNQNSEADALANEAMNARKSWKTYSFGEGQIAHCGDKINIIKANKAVPVVRANRHSRPRDRYKASHNHNRRRPDLSRRNPLAEKKSVDIRGNTNFPSAECIANSKCFGNLSKTLTNGAHWNNNCVAAGQQSKFVGKAKKKKVYAVAEGIRTGIFETWLECESYVKGFKGSVFKSFPNRDEAQIFLDHHEARKQLKHEGAF